MNYNEYTLRVPKMSERCAIYRVASPERNTPLIQRVTSTQKKHTIRVHTIQQLTSARKKHTSDPTAQSARRKHTIRVLLPAQFLGLLSRPISPAATKACQRARVPKSPPSSSRHFSLYIYRLGRHCHITSKLISATSSLSHGFHHTHSNLP